MPRPASHREQSHPQSCGTCRHSHLVAYKLHLLCFHGDVAEVTGEAMYCAEHIELDGRDVGMLEGDEYDRVWGGRVVESDDVCDEWEPE